MLNYGDPQGWQLEVDFAFQTSVHTIPAPSFLIHLLIQYIFMNVHPELPPGQGLGRQELRVSASGSDS